MTNDEGCTIAGKPRRIRRYKAGDLLGMLTIVSIAVIDNQKTAICVCNCGNECRKRTSSLKAVGGKTLQASCGCLKKAMALARIVKARASRSPESLERIKLNVKKGRKTIDPTPEEIAQRSAEIRAEWPPERFAKYDSGRRPVEAKTCKGGSDVDYAERLM